jgi:uncharacterized membrane protein YvlD (DUF360 family)
MPRLLAQVILSLLANALALLAASMLLIGFAINVRGFVVAVCIFTGVDGDPGAVDHQNCAKKCALSTGWHRLVTTFVGLLVTTLVTDGLSITGVRTWLIATLVIWLATIVASLVLPRFLFKEVLGNQSKTK